MRILPSPSCPLAVQSIFGQNVRCGSMTHLPSALSTEECHSIRSFFQVQSSDHRLAYTDPAGESCVLRKFYESKIALRADDITQHIIEEIKRLVDHRVGIGHAGVHASARQRDQAAC